MGIFSVAILRAYILVAAMLTCSIFTVALLHPHYTHHHPGEVIHDESPSHGHEDPSEAYNPFATHGHEEKTFLGLSVVLLVVGFFRFDQSFTQMIRTVFSVERRDLPRRKPPILNLLFAQGILHPRNP